MGNESAKCLNLVLKLDGCIIYLSIIIISHDKKRATVQLERMLLDPVPETPIP